MLADSFVCRCNFRYCKWMLNGAVLGDDCIVGAGALVTGKMNAPAGSLLLGSPAKVVRELTQEEKDSLLPDALHYIELAKNGL